MNDSVTISFLKNVVAAAKKNNRDTTGSMAHDYYNREVRSARIITFSVLFLFLTLTLLGVALVIFPTVMFLKVIGAALAIFFIFSVWNLSVINVMLYLKDETQTKLTKFLTPVGKRQWEKVNGFITRAGAVAFLISIDEFVAKNEKKQEDKSD